MEDNKLVVAVSASGGLTKDKGTSTHRSNSLISGLFRRRSNLAFFFLQANLVENTVVAPNYHGDLVKMAEQIQNVRIQLISNN